MRRSASGLFAALLLTSSASAQYAANNYPNFSQYTNVGGFGFTSGNSAPNTYVVLYYGGGPACVSLTSPNCHQSSDCFTTQVTSTDSVPHNLTLGIYQSNGVSGGTQTYPSWNQATTIAAYRALDRFGFC